MAGNGYAGLGPGAFEDAVARQLLPRGLAWQSTPGGVMAGYFETLADGLAAFHALEAQLTEREAFPPSAVWLLPRWESVLGLPDPCLGVNPTTSARQAAVAARLAASGGQSVPYFEELAVNLGGAITITEYQPYRCGVDTCWSPIRCPAWAHVWLVTLEQGAEFDFECGISACWEPLWQIANQPISCEITRLKPAHTQVNFAIAEGVVTGGSFLADISQTDSLAVVN